MGLPSRLEAGDEDCDSDGGEGDNESELLGLRRSAILAILSTKEILVTRIDKLLEVAIHVRSEVEICVNWFET
jgi:hypothetical protein